MNNNEDYSTLIYLAGSLFSKVQELQALLKRLEETGAFQGELHLTHRLPGGESTQLLVHVDGPEFTMMPGETDPGFRLDISGASTHLE